MAIQHFEVGRLEAVADLPAILTIDAGFRPPAVQNGAVEHAVHGGLHAGRAAGFQRSARIVKPDV
ncbi:hypothetical protein D3C76_1443910 [compost metagenome]